VEGSDKVAVLKTPPRTGPCAAGLGLEADAGDAAGAEDGAGAGACVQAVRMLVPIRRTMTITENITLFTT
jgi:hypothetical protein